MKAFDKKKKSMLKNRLNAYSLVASLITAILLWNYFYRKQLADIFRKSYPLRFCGWQFLKNSIDSNDVILVLNNITILFCKDVILVFNNMTFFEVCESSTGFC